MRNHTSAGSGAGQLIVFEGSYVTEPGPPSSSQLVRIEGAVSRRAPESGRFKGANVVGVVTKASLADLRDHRFVVTPSRPKVSGRRRARDASMDSFAFCVNERGALFFRARGTAVIRPDRHIRPPSPAPTAPLGKPTNQSRMARVWAEFNDLDIDGRIPLGVKGNVKELSGVRIRGQTAVRVLLYDHDSEVEGVLELLDGEWFAKVDWDSFVYTIPLRSDRPCIPVESALADIE